jgi:hypothetical protein
MGRLKSPAAWVAAVCAVLPLIGAEVWSGFRLALPDPVLGAIAPGEQPLSVRSVGGVWAMLLALVWFGLAYWRRDLRWWEVSLVILGTAAALIRTGNAWLEALALIAPLARQSGLLAPPRWILASAAAISLVVAGVSVYVTRPPALPGPALAAAAAANPSGGTVFADWRWAPQLQRELANQKVLAAGGLASESPEFWLNYVRIVEDYEQWPSELQAMQVNLLVLNSQDPALADQVRASPDWQVLYDTDNAFVAQRTTS